MSDTFDPVTNGWKIQRGYSIRPLFQVETEESEIGSVDSVVVSERVPRRVENLRLRTTVRTAFEYLDSFFRRLKGPAARFYFAWPELVSSPDAAPTVAAVAGGALAERTVTIRYVWKNSVGTTLPSPTATIVVPANEYVKVTLDAYPASVTQAVIYGAEGDPGNEQEQVTLTSQQSWTQSAALLVATAAVPTSNTATETPLCRLVDYRVERGVGTSYEATLTLEEVYQ